MGLEIEARERRTGDFRVRSDFLVGATLFFAPRTGARTRSSGVLYGEPETARFLAAVERLKQAKQRRVRQTRQAKQRVRATLRKTR